MKFLRKLGSHYAIERFGILFLSLSIAMCILLGSIFVRKVQFDLRELDGRAVYTTSFAFSLSQTTGSVRGVFVNQDHTKCMVLLQMADMSELATEASKYEAYLCGSDTDSYYEGLESRPSGVFYLLGNTGYMGIYLEDVNGFPSQIMSLLLRSNGYFKNNAQQSQMEDNSDIYDQTRVYFNPGGTYATVVNFMDDPDWEASDMYDELIIKNSESAVRYKLYEDLIEMAKQQRIMKEYTKRLVDAGMAEPSVPTEITKDVVHVTADGEDLFWDSELSAYTDGEVYYTDDTANFSLEAGYIFPGGLNFTWQDSSVKDGYLKTLTNSEDTADWRKYLDDLTDKKESVSLEFPEEWHYSDGSLFDMASENLSNEDANIKKNIEGLQAAWQAYYDAKQKYQTEDLYDLLELEYDLQVASTTYQVNAKDFLHLY